MGCRLQAADREMTCRLWATESHAGKATDKAGPGESSDGDRFLPGRSCADLQSC